MELLLIASVIAFVFGLSLSFLTIKLNIHSFLSGLIQNKRINFFLLLKPFEKDFDQLYDFYENLEKKLAYANDFLNINKKALNMLSEGVLFINKVLSLFYLNNEAANLLGLSTQNVGKSLKYTLKDVSLYDFLEDTVQKGPLGHKKELRITRKNEVTYLQLVVQYLGDSLYIVRIVNLTDKKKLEMVRSDFIANVAHELKTPITTINGFLETLLDGALEDEKLEKKFLNIAKAHTERMNRLINELFILSNIELGNVQLHLSDYNVCDMIKEAIGILLPQIKDKNLSLNVQCNESFVIRCDKDKMMQILINIVENALKYTNEGGISIRTCEDPKEGFVCIDVEDTGIGIPRADLPRITERFYRVDKARSKVLGGTGLGLAIVKHLLQLQEGNLVIESDAGKGTLVKLFIPIRSYDEEEKIATI